MKSLIFVLVVVASVFCNAGCGKKASACHPKQGISELKLLRVDKAIDDASKAFKSGDHRFLGIYGYSREIPGVAGDPYEHMKDTKMLEGTGDVFCGEEEHMLNKNARIYAKQYNEEILRELNGR